MEKSYEYPKSKKFINRVGQVFGRLTVVEFAFIGIFNNKSLTYWKCLCSCGIEKMVSSSNLNSGRNDSCGCLQRELSAKRHTTHGLTVLCMVFQNKLFVTL